MTSDKVVVALRDELTRRVFGGELAARSAGLPALEGIVDTPSLLARLDAEAPRSEARDALLADLLRLHRRARDGAALNAVLYAVHAGVVRRCERLVASLEPREGAAQIACALLASLDRFDPDRRSRHVEHGVCEDTWHRLWLLRGGEQRERRVHARLAELVSHACADLEAGAWEDLLGSPSRATVRRVEAEDAERVEALAEALTAQGLLKLRDAQLLCRTALQGRRVPEVAQELGMKEAAAKKALQRAKARLLARKDRLRLILMSLSSTAETF